MFVALFVIVIVGAIVLHELGHFATAKAFGMKASQFFVGFGPTIWSTQRGETEYGVKWIPAGGFVKIIGMTPWEDTDPADDGRLFYQYAPWKRFIVLVSGSVIHVILAILFLLGGLAFVGVDVLTNGVSQVSEASPAEAAGLEAGEEIVAVDGEATPTFDAISAAVADRFGDTLTLTIAGGGSERTVEVTLDVPHPNPDRAGFGFLGVSPEVEQRAFGVADATRIVFAPSASEALVGTGQNYSFAFLTTTTVEGLTQVFSLEGLGRFFGSLDEDAPREEESVTSLVGAGQIVSEFGNRGEIFAVLVVLAQLNLVLGILNMLPLPPLDGGHVAVMFIEEAVNGARRLRGAAKARPKFHLNPSIVTPVALAVIAFFLVLTSAALYLDITSPASELVQ
ncbi:M50 family metallopeptidase [Euzebya tangerina]|uniref:M50 family metallopeptidase n=1 Tax=Euzebya tangerina TaxID=591198 RepID=UPI000E31E57D|nr:site-2 protease family protein [Euzebya tangerina]